MKDDGRILILAAILLRICDVRMARVSLWNLRPVRKARRVGAGRLPRPRSAILEM